MKKPAPRLPNGKPSMSGLWGQVRRADVTNKNIPGYVPELPYTAWGKKQWDEYTADKGDYTGSCLPFGLSRTLYGPHPIQIIQDNDFLVFLAEHPAKRTTRTFLTGTSLRGVRPAKKINKGE